MKNKPTVYAEREKLENALYNLTRYVNFLENTSFIILFVSLLIGTLIIFFGLMLTPDGPRVLEYNARFGDPEAQVVLPRLKNDIIEVIDACIDGTLDKVELEFEDNAAVCVVLASDGAATRSVGHHNPIAAVAALRGGDSASLHIRRTSIHRNILHSLRAEQRPRL